MQNQGEPGNCRFFKGS